MATIALHTNQSSGSSHAGHIARIDAHDHSVHFYNDPVVLARSVAQHLHAAMQARLSAVVIARPLHRELFLNELRTLGVEEWRLTDRTELLMLDAEDTLAQFMDGAMPDGNRFRAVVGGALNSLLHGREEFPVCAYGEMVDVLWERGNTAGAMSLEELWNDLAASYRFNLLCAYNTDSFSSSSADRAHVDSICARHTHVHTLPGVENLYAFQGVGTARLTLAPNEAQRIAELEKQVLTLSAELLEREVEIGHAREAVIDANKSRYAFLGLVSHDLRTPLNAISGFAELVMLEMQGPLTDKQRGSLDAVLRNQKQLMERLDQMMTYTRVMAGDVRYELYDTPLNATLLAVESRVMPDVKAQGLRYVYSRCEASIRVHTDPEKLLFILTRLVRNAIKFTPADGSIAVETKCVPGAVRVIVTDTGCGMSGGQAAALFELPRQADHTGARTGKGLALGLAIARAYARDMGGDLTVKTQLGGGTAFTLSLPYADSSGSHAAIPTTAHSLTLA